MTYILIDTSYLIFYRYFALLQWWKLANPNNPLPDDPYESQEFVDKFKKMISESVQKLKLKLKLKKEKVTVIAARDCPRKDIWRNNLYHKYKETRDKDDKFMGGNFFKMVYDNENDMLYKAGIDYVFKNDNIEADDVIAITKNILREKYNDKKIIIIANDHDYLQLLDDNTSIINLQNKNLIDNKKVYLEGEKNLFVKIILGDKSDCIEPVFKKCNVKMAEYYYENNDKFLEALEKENAHNKFNLNNKLINFSEIPLELVDYFIKKYENILKDS